MSDPQSQKIAAAREATSPINVATLSMDLFPLRLQPDLNQAAAGLVGVLHRLTSNAGSFVAGSQEDPAAVAVGDAAQDSALWPDRLGPS